MTALLTIYKTAIGLSAPLLKVLLQSRLKKGKEDFARIHERMGIPSRQRPQGHLIWIHAASVGEAQSALILIDAIGKESKNTHVLVTTGTLTSANLMESRLPPSFAFHQYIPIDHPDWIDDFIDYWTPDFAIWMESELWPNTLMSLKSRNIPIILANARLSDKSYDTWKKYPKSAKALLSCFDSVLTQTKQDEERFITLGAQNVSTVDNIKYSALPLPCDPMSLRALELATHNRPLWVYASTHDGEEELAAQIHKRLKKDIPNLLTIIVPRHPNRRDDIKAVLDDIDVRHIFRLSNETLPCPQDDIYVADTLGELGLFYTLCPVAVIGRSFSKDGGGGHNPIEAAQLGCVVLTGPNNQFQRPLYDDMAKDKAVIEAQTKDGLYQEIKNILLLPTALDSMKQKTLIFVNRKSHIVDDVMGKINPYLKKMGE